MIWSRFVRLDSAKAALLVFAALLFACNGKGDASGGTGNTPSAPVITSFTATPDSVAPGGSATLAWTVTGATSLSLDQNVGSVTGLNSKVVNPTTTTQYTLTAANTAGHATRIATVTVTQATVATPTFDPNGGTFNAPQQVTISTATGGAAIHFTTDGSTPTAASPQYTSAITVDSSETLKAIAVLAGYADSDVASADFTIQVQGSETVYCGGYYNMGDISNRVERPCYWVGDSQRVDLDATGFTNGQVAKIQTYNHTVYCIGNDHNGTRNFPYYWIGAQRYAFDTQGTIDAGTTCLAVVDGNIYAGGYFWVDYSNQTPCYWDATGGTNNRHSLSSTGTNKGTVCTSQIDGSALYFGGQYGDDQIPCYWNATQGTDPTRLPAASLSYGSVFYILASGTKISCIANGGGNTVRCDWDGTAVNYQTIALDDTGTKWISPVVYYIDNGTLYCGGEYTIIQDALYKDVPCYWVGTVRHDLPTAGNGYFARVFSVCVRNGVLFCGGCYNNGTQQISCYWKIDLTSNDIQRFDLPVDNNYEATVRSIFVE